jgi:hypothetical protein
MADGMTLDLALFVKFDSAALSLTQHNTLLDLLKTFREQLFVYGIYLT